MRRPGALSLAVLAAVALPAPAARAVPAGPPQVVASGLGAPWEVAPLPDGRVLLTDRDRGLRFLRADGAVADAGGSSPDQVKRLGLAVHPGWAQNRFVYFYETYDAGSGTLRNRVVRLVDEGASLRRDRVVLDGIRSDGSHDGGRMAFGPDGRLYVTTGDVHDPATPRDRQSLNGKILRVEAPGTDADGAPAAGNPFAGEGGNARYVWSLGHRHPQGLAWDADGRLWETEHGPSGEGHAPSGATCCRDELNLIVAGGDYGWPSVSGDQTLAGTIPPVVHSGTETWAPGGLAFGGDGLLYAPALRGRHLRVFEPSGATIARHYPLFGNDFGRMRTAVAVPGALLLTTDEEGASRVLRVGLTGTPPAAAPVAPAPAAPAGDRTPPRLTVRAARRQRVLRRGAVAARAGCDEACRVRVTGVLRVGARRLRLRRAEAAVAAGRTALVRVRLTRRSRAALRPGLRRGLRVRVVLTVGATDAAGNATRRTAVVRVRR